MKHILPLLLAIIPFINLYAQKKTPKMDYQLITETVTNIFVGADERDWPMIKEAFDSKILLDYSSLTGQPAATLSADDIIASWKKVFPGFKNTHHQLGNFKVTQTEKEATVFCYGTATHYLPNDTHQDTWTVVGTYNFHLVHKNGQWKVDLMKMNFKYQEGNTSLPQMAIEKATQLSQQ